MIKTVWYSVPAKTTNTFLETTIARFRTMIKNFLLTEKTFLTWNCSNKLKKNSLYFVSERRLLRRGRLWGDLPHLRRRRDARRPQPPPRGRLQREGSVPSPSPAAAAAAAAHTDESYEQVEVAEEERGKSWRIFFRGKGKKWKGSADFAEEDMGRRKRAWRICFLFKDSPRQSKAEMCTCKKNLLVIDCDTVWIEKL